MSEPVYRRILLKISGEALAGDAGRGLDFNIIGEVCQVVKKWGGARLHGGGGGGRGHVVRGQ